MLILEAQRLLDVVSQGLARPRIGFHLHQRSLVRCQFDEHLLAAAQFLPQRRVRRSLECFQRGERARVEAKGGSAAPHKQGFKDRLGQVSQQIQNWEETQEKENKKNTHTPRTRTLELLLRV